MMLHFGKRGTRSSPPHAAGGSGAGCRDCPASKGIPYRRAAAIDAVGAGSSRARPGAWRISPWTQGEANARWSVHPARNPIEPLRTITHK